MHGCVLLFSCSPHLHIYHLPGVPFILLSQSSLCEQTLGSFTLMFSTFSHSPSPWGPFHFTLTIFLMNKHLEVLLSCSPHSHIHHLPGVPFILLSQSPLCEQLYRLTPSHVPMKTRNYSRKFCFMHQDTS